MNDQTQLFVPKITPAAVEELKSFLSHNGWQTRSELCEKLAWSERTLRKTAEMAGPEVLRGPRGFNLTRRAQIEEIRHCAHRFALQRAEMERFEIGWMRIAHEMVGATGTSR